ncbi:hypothetical protein V6N13_131157 [Hibiscus sabdariffa]|uniref:Uncharacterized protein n=1 Tax=Hibiscus sabdariffa TaxID=183260 RepID=A0ABR2D726_9ROSI
MSSNRDDTTNIAMPELPQSDFIREKNDKFKLAVLEVQNQEPRSSPGGPKPLIQRVPSLLINVKADFKKCFEPKVVALGPLHHGDPKFQFAEQPKLRSAAAFALENKTTHEILFDKIKAEIQDLRKCYKPDDIKDYDDEYLAWMLFVDGCAVLCAVTCGMEGDSQKLITKSDLLVLKQLGLLLLEHQIPYRVLQILVDSASDPQRWKNALIHFIAQNLVTNVPGGQTSQNAVKYADKEDYAHLLDWFRAEHLMGNEVKRESSTIGKMFMSCGEGRRHKKTVRRIKKLKESGIRVKPSNTRTITNISFYCNFKGEVMMPHLWVDCSTASKLMNLVALEMCEDFHNGYEVIAYLCFMDSLIDTPEDVKELEDTGVLHNNLGTDEAVAHLFNELASDLPAHPGPSVYQDVVNHIHKYCNSPWTNVVSKTSRVGQCMKEYQIIAVIRCMFRCIYCGC